jgi:PKD repeat protein
MKTYIYYVGFGVIRGMAGYLKRIIALCMFLCIHSFLYSSFWTEWFEYSLNPVLDPANPAVHAYYPSVSYNINQFDGHGIAAYYKMWFNRDENGGIALAYSNDGIAWTEYSGSAALPGLVAGADHPVVVYDSGGFGGGIYYYKIWYWNIYASYASVAGIRTAESVDGINWVNDQPATQHATDSNLQLIFGPWGTYFYHNYGPGYVIYNSTATNTGWATPTDKSDDVPMSFRYVLYYLVAGEGGTPNGTAEQEGLAYSVDGIYWIRYGTTPVLMGSGNPADWDYSYLYGASIAIIGGTWHMWYIGANGDGSVALPYAHGIGHATSPDGLNWTRDADNPAMHYSDGIAWRSRGMHSKSVVYDPSNFSGHGDPYPVKMWYSGVDAAGNDTIGYAWLPAFFNTPPVACFAQDVSEGFPPLAVNFDASCSNDPDGTIVNYRWQFSDGTTAAGVNYAKLFSVPGTFTVTLTVTDNGGVRSSASRTVVVDSPVRACCYCNNGLVVSGWADLTLHFDASCSETLNGNSIVSYIWDFGNEDTMKGITAIYTYIEAGTYIVRVTVIDSDGYEQTTQCVSSIQVNAVYPPDGQLIRLERSINRSLFRGAAIHKIQWSANSRNDGLNIMQYRIYRKNASEQESEYIQIGFTDNETREFIDKDLPMNIKYFYVITSVESGGHESKYSLPVENMIE